jgi:hypothetical protein
MPGAGRFEQSGVGRDHDAQEFNAWRRLRAVGTDATVLSQVDC